MGRKPGARGKTEQITVSIPAELLSELESEAGYRGMSRSSMTVMMIDLYFRDQRVMATPVQSQTGPLGGMELDALKAISSQLEAIERKADRSIEVGLSTREAVRATPDLIREDLVRHMENLRSWSAEVMKTGADTLTLVSEQLEELLTKLSATGRAINVIWDRINGKSEG